ncbi:MAG: ATP-binding protein [Bacteroidia bacterium]|nr:ATP-binding protein [Bacteroidia bacterium]
MNATFKVDPRLASLLGENYRSTELAIKELVDNAFDADAENVWVELPSPLSTEPLIIKDDGTGMTESEIRNEYLNIASSRVSRKGERTRLKNRLVKGRKGIGKFAGLMVASLMEVSSDCRGKQTILSIWRDELMKAKQDLEQVSLPIRVKEVAKESHGTTISLMGINQNFTFPNPNRLKRLLVLEYGRQTDFHIYVNGELVDLTDIPGETFEEAFALSNGELATLRFTIAHHKHSLKQSGIAFRVGGKIVGSPKYFGMDEEERFPARMLKRLYGEIEANSLEKDVTADWGSVIDNSLLLNEIKLKIRPALVKAFDKIFQAEMEMAKARLRKRMNGSISHLPESKKGLANNVLDKVLRKFYGESESRMASVVSLILEAVEQNSNPMLTLDLNLERREAYAEFGLQDVAMIAQQSSRRLMILEQLSEVLLSADTPPEKIREAISTNLWLLGSNYTLVSTNNQLVEVARMYVGHKWNNGHAHEAPNLLLLQDFNKGFLVLDLKPADHTVELLDRRKAKEYQSDLKVYLPGRDIEVIVIGGALSPNLVGQKANASIKFLSYKGMITDAKVQLNWLAGELQRR